MLMMVFPLLLLLFTKPKWNYIIMFLSCLSPLIMMHLFSIPTPINMSMSWGFDLMSSMLIILTLWIMPLVIAASQSIYQKKNNSDLFTFSVCALTLILVASFSVSSLFSFYILFEASLIPTVLIVMKWGYQPERLQASMYLMLYTITASLPLLAGIAIFSMKSNLSNFFFSLHPFIFYSSSMWIMMNLAFMVKLPLFLFHLWLPKAHVEAPVAGSMILAAVLLKLGGYGMLRMIYMIPPVSPSLKIYLLSLSLWGGMITSLICARQHDMKSLIAYSSVGHMSLVMAGVLSNINWGVWGAMTMMISHGLLSSTLFASADMNYSMSNSRILVLNKGLNIVIPSMTMLWFLMCAANMAAPPSSNLMAEIMLMTCSIIMSKWTILPLGIMSFTAAAYSLTLYVTMNHGPINAINNPSLTLTPRNLMIITSHLVPIVVIMLMPSLIVLW